MDTAKSIRVALAMRGVSQPGLAEKVGVGTNYISRMANGRALLQGVLLEKVATTLGFKVSEFIALGED